MQEISMPDQSKVIAFDIDQASLISLRKALPDSLIEVVNGATASSLTQDWNPGTVDLVVVKARKEVAETLELCRFLVSCGVLAKDAPVVTDSQEEIPKTLGLHRRRRNVARRPHSPLLVLVHAFTTVTVVQVFLLPGNVPGAWSGDGLRDDHDSRFFFLIIGSGCSSSPP